uniref:Uncharacterized protein n=1 Tax=Panagrolaimus sp. PS1159 TaxID=55785 RepID=A0AC35F3Z1_9BILA
MLILEHIVYVWKTLTERPTPHPRRYADAAAAAVARRRNSSSSSSSSSSDSEESAPPIVRKNQSRRNKRGSRSSNSNSSRRRGIRSKRGFVSRRKQREDGCASPKERNRKCQLARNLPRHSNGTFAPIGFVTPPNRSSRYLQQKAPDEPALKNGRAISLSNFNEEESEVDEDEEEAESDLNDVVVDQAVEKDLGKFLEPGERWKSLFYDLIRQKILEKNSNLIPLGDPRDSNIPPEAVRFYNEVGHILSRYCSGKIPIAFKNLGTMHNWEQLIEYTHPESLTMMFVSNQKRHQCQRFQNTILLPSIRDEIAAHKKLSQHLYECVFKSCFKPSAFYKGIVLPPAASESCTLTESVIIGSVILKRHIPAMQSCAAIYQLAQSYANDLSGGEIELLQLVIKEKQRH